MKTFIDDQGTAIPACGRLDKRLPRHWFWNKTNTIWGH